MDILSEVYYKSAADNERNLRFWENYLHSLQSLDFSLYSDKLKVPTLVPIGSRILFRGELKHTNEVTVALGADYFVKCSLKQAEVLRQHRIKDAQSKVDLYNKEKEYLENQMSFTKKAVYDNQGQEIIEYYTEEDDKAWWHKHRENIRQYKQSKGKENVQKETVTDDELWNRLEELELQEELENELSSMDGDGKYLNNCNKSKEESFIDKEDYIQVKNDKDDANDTSQAMGDSVENKHKKETFKETKTPEQTHKTDLLQQVIDKQNELEEKLHELKNRERSQTKSETDLMSRLDELEQLDELEDEMDRLDDIIENEDEEDGILNETNEKKQQRSVFFADEDDRETLEITFKHSPVESCNEPYDPSKGIQKPSDIYEAHSNLFENGPTSILKKSKYEAIAEAPEIKVPKERKVKICETQETIVVKDVVEKVNQVEHKLLSQARPTSLFKKKRMQSKS